MTFDAPIARARQKPRRPARRDRLEVESVRRDFPALAQQVKGKRLAYLDSAATAQKPRAVIEALAAYYGRDNANVHRGVHTLSTRATEAYEGARAKVRRFLGAARCEEIVLVRGATEAINLVAWSFGEAQVRAGDEILVTTLEHHSNIVPWQMLCARKGAVLRVAPIDDRGDVVLEEYKKLLGPRTRLVAVAQVSNALGTINPVGRMIRMAHRQGIPVLVDGAQAVPHMNVDVGGLDCDFYVFSGHKMFGPTGIGALYGKAHLLEEMPPYQGGGDMIEQVTFAKTSYNDPPYKFEAGTPNIAGAVGLAAAIDYLNRVGLDSIAAYEAELLRYATDALSGIPEVVLLGTARRKASVLCFNVAGVHPHDVGTILDGEGIAVRTGHHCAQPLMERLGVEATVRASLAFYNTREEIDRLAAGIRKVVQVFR